MKLPRDLSGTEVTRWLTRHELGGGYPGSALVGSEHGTMETM